MTDLITRLRSRTLVEHGGPNGLAHGWNLTPNDSALHKEAADHIEELLGMVERFRADAERFRWLDEHALTVDMVSDPDNLVLVWHGTTSHGPTRGRALREAIDAARAKDAT